MAIVDFKTRSPALDTGKTARFYVVRVSDGKWWNALTSAFETYSAGNYATTKYLIAMTEVGATAYWRGTFPAGITANTIVNVVAVFDTVAGTPAVSDLSPAKATYTWDGSNLLVPADARAIGGTTQTGGDIGKLGAAIDEDGLLIVNVQSFQGDSGAVAALRNWLPSLPLAVVVSATSTTVTTSLTDAAGYYAAGSSLTAVYGTGVAHETREVVSYDGAGVFTIAPAWTVVPGADAALIIGPPGMDPAAITALATGVTGLATSLSQIGTILTAIKGAGWVPGDNLHAIAGAAATPAPVNQDVRIGSQEVSIT